MSTPAYLCNPIYLSLRPDHARTLATVISDNGKVAMAGDFRFMEKPLLRKVVKLQRAGTNEHVFFYHIIVEEPGTRYKASYEMISTEKLGSFLRYRGMRPRLFTHFGLVPPEEVRNSCRDVSNFLQLLEEINSGYPL